VALEPGRQNIDKLGFEDMIFDRAKLIDVRNRPNFLIDRPDIEPFFSKNDDADFLMVFSGASLLRESNPKEYSERWPSFTTDSAKFIIEETKVNGVAMDFVAVDSPEDLAELNAPVHYIFEGRKDVSSRGIVLIEDANLLPILGKKIHRVFAMPLLLKGVDASPVNMFAEVA
jgi:arylformamidase